VKLSNDNERRSEGMKSAIVKRSVVIGGQKTSVSLEDSFWSALKDLAREQNVPLCELINSINAQRSAGNLSSALRLFVLEHFRERAMHFRTARVGDLQRDASGMPSP
jgi:predicted DNA-binding ribbon-helix-helix protein